jgi:anti-anti-sigma regulatory factor
VFSVDKKELADGSLHVTLSGEIGDHFDGAGIIAADAPARVVLHLGGVRSLTSLGVRAFEQLIASARGRELTLVHISPAVAAQLIMIPTLSGGARVESAKLPFRCAACGAERSHTVPWDARGHLDHAPTCSCGAKMELDGLAEQYLPS